MNYSTMNMPTKNSEASLAFQYDGVHLHNHCRSQGLILATSEQDARLLLRNQQVVALKLSLVSATNPLVSAQGATVPLNKPLGRWFSLWTQRKHRYWHTQTLSLLATALDQAPLLPALATVERQLSLLNAPAVWPAAMLMWRDGLAKGLSCSKALHSFASVWGEEWLAWVTLSESQGMPLAPLEAWIKAEHYRQTLQAGLKPVMWRCYGWGITSILLGVIFIFLHVQQAIATLIALLPLVVVGYWVIQPIKKRFGLAVETLLKSAQAQKTLNGWAVWWLALHLQSHDEANTSSPLEALQMAVHLPSAQQAIFLHHALAAVEEGQPLEQVLSQSPHLPVGDRLRFEAVQDSNGLRQAIQACWHHAETTLREQRLRWWTGLDIVLTLVSLSLVIGLMVHS